MGYIGYIFGINLGVAVNNAVNKTEKRMSQKMESKTITNMKNSVYSDATISFENHGVVDCDGGFEITAAANSSAEVMLAIESTQNAEFTNDVFDTLLVEVENEITQKNETAIFDTNASFEVNNTLNKHKVDIDQIISTSIQTSTNNEAESKGTVTIVNKGTMKSKGKCIFGADAASIAVANVITEQLTDLLQTNELSLEMDNKATNKADQTNTTSPLMMLLIILFIGAPVLGGGGAAAGGSIVGAIIFLIFAVGFGVALIFVDTKKCEIDGKFKDPKVTKECEDDDDKDKSDEGCLECEDGSEMVNKPFESGWFIACLAACCVSALISIILFAVYTMGGPKPEADASAPSSSGSLQEHQNQLGGGETLFKVFKRYLKKI